MATDQRGKPTTRPDVPKIDSRGNNGHYLSLNLRKVVPHNLDDIDITTNFPIPIDQEIMPLNKAVNLFGLYSVASCSGHMDGKSTPFPWVNFAITNEEAKEGKDTVATALGGLKDSFTSALRRYNSKHTIKWNTRELRFQDQAIGIRLRPDGEAMDAGGLSFLQDSSVSLADSLFKEVMRKGDLQARLAARDDRYIQLMRGTLT